MPELNPLNPEQLEAASHGEGPALVLAGPGSGKTTTLVGRYCRLVQAGVAQSAILTTTFTKRAANALKERIRGRLGVDTRSLPVTTFHAFCNRLLSRDAIMPAVRAWEVLEDDRKRFAILRSLASPETGDAEDLANRIDWFKDRLITPEQAQAQARSAPRARRASELEIANAYERYQRHLREHRPLDFGDMIVHTTVVKFGDGTIRRIVTSYLTPIHSGP